MDHDAKVLVTTSKEEVPYTGSRNRSRQPENKKHLNGGFNHSFNTKPSLVSLKQAKDKNIGIWN